jgi:hypothetical protein
MEIPFTAEMQQDPTVEPPIDGHGDLTIDLMALVTQGAKVAKVATRATQRRVPKSFVTVCPSPSNPYHQGVVACITPLRLQGRPYR